MSQLTLVLKYVSTVILVEGASGLASSIALASAAAAAASIAEGLDFLGADLSAIETTSSLEILANPSIMYS